MAARFVLEDVLSISKGAHTTKAIVGIVRSRQRRIDISDTEKMQRASVNVTHCQSEVPWKLMLNADDRLHCVWSLNIRRKLIYRDRLPRTLELCLSRQVGIKNRISDDKLLLVLPVQPFRIKGQVLTNSIVEDAKALANHSIGLMTDSRD